LRKIRSLIGKIVLTTLAVLLLCSPWMMSASAVNIAQIPAATIYMNPFRIQGNSGDTIIVNATIADVTELFSFQIGARFDPATVNCTSVVEGGFLSDNGADFVLPFPGSIDNVNGVVVPYGWTLTVPGDAKTGNGILVRFTFRLKVDGFSDVHIYGYKGIWIDATTQIPTKTIDYHTAVISSVQYIVKIVGNARGSAPAGQGGYSLHSVTTIAEPPYTGQFSFRVIGFATGDPANNWAYFNATIPKALMWCDTIDQWFVKLNDVQQATRIVSENATHTTISLEFTYAQAVQTVKIQSIYIVPEFSSVFFAILLVLATFAAAIFGKATWSAKRKN